MHSVAGSYYMPEGLDLGKLEDFAANPEWIIDDANSTEPMNVKERVDDFVWRIQPLADNVRGNDLMLTMGADFGWDHGAQE